MICTIITYHPVELLKRVEATTYFAAFHRLKQFLESRSFFREGPITIFKKTQHTVNNYSLFPNSNLEFFC